MRSRILGSIIVAASLAASGAQAAPQAKKTERTVLTLQGANFRPLPLAIAPPIYSASSASRQYGQEIDDTMTQDLAVSGLFELLDRKSFLSESNEGALASDIKFSRWQDIGAEALIKTVITGSDPITAEFHLYNTVAGKDELTRRYNAPANQARSLAHKFADEVFTFYTREPGVFQTKLSFVRKVKGLKQIFVADWDGKNARALTSGSMNLLPFWSANGSRVAFTSYKSGNPDLTSVDVRSQKQDTIFHKNSGITTGGAYSPDGRKIVFSVSEDDGNSHIWVANADGSGAKRLTEGFGINSSPCFSPDGKQIAFVSNRAGNPQIYVMPSSGGGARRLTFQGNYNQTPDWSPRGDAIAFTARDERSVLDIFTVEVASGKITRLTQDQGNNEEPTFSPNGRLIAFTSTRAGGRQLFVMSADGNSQRPMGNKEETFTPAWGPFVK